MRTWLSAYPIIEAVLNLYWIRRCVKCTVAHGYCWISRALWFITTDHELCCLSIIFRKLDSYNSNCAKNVVWCHTYCQSTISLTNHSTAWGKWSLKPCRLKSINSSVHINRFQGSICRVQLKGNTGDSFCTVWIFEKWNWSRYVRSTLNWCGSFVNDLGCAQIIDRA